MTLLEQAKSIERRKQKYEFNDETLELALAWLHDDVTSKQVAVTLLGNYKSFNHLYPLALILQEAVRKKKIKIIYPILE
jgi:hypothetical protein